MSYHDQLTEIYNRRFFEEEVNRLNVARNYPLTIMMADVNGLKLINDSFGHETGDLLLKKVARLLRLSCREDDIVSRIGGDEFVILLPKTHPKKAEEIADRIQALIATETIESIDISVSLGWAAIFSNEDHYSEVLKQAENYLYRKKLFESPSMHNKSIHTIIHTLHEKNKREELHAYRVSMLCEGIGRALGFNELKVKELKHLGLLHDIGKIAINEQLLNKPGQLTQEEWFEMTKHPEIGYRILSTVNEMTEMAESVLSHHERYDGKGYPRGIGGADIPINARIICIADAYDAMTSDRPYRSALAHEKAIEELKLNSGTQFDPAIVLAFIKMMTDTEGALLDHSMINLVSELEILFK
jgi:diguanylate cyclase (GGDEF)-like protein